jgi:hypothetical protein
MRPITVIIAAFGLLALFLANGCSSGGPKTFPVQGKIEIAGGNVEDLAGCHVETALVSDNTKHSSGEIKKDGSFVLETNETGITRRGAREGKHEVRIIIALDDRKAQIKAEQTVAPRFLDFKSSGLTIDVPTKGPVILALSRN